ncbi:hypothetical protein DPMN_155949 [Dreissena polymorpha]|uniref:Uncharacterized protein n=1 Tax=Dreissena polymorpha TaxID=45954 RepID=A0A9D4FQB8_DREPO|nr:hypothetical protein DPMN_155949 [Dreissena polymorpha]
MKKIKESKENLIEEQSVTIYQKMSSCSTRKAYISLKTLLWPLLLPFPKHNAVLVAAVASITCLISSEGDWVWLKRVVVEVVALLTVAFGNLCVNVDTFSYIHSSVVFLISFITTLFIL